jgi:serine-type D-Ala-D-Ala carboxypeptidase/endopeptidase (penicillin-binding protein 4)
MQSGMRQRKSYIDTMIGTGKLKLLFLLLFFFFQRIASAQFPTERIQELEQQLDAITSPVSSSGITISAKVLHADFNKTLYEYQPEIKVIPASITKLVTTACAYTKLGQSYNFQTVIYTDDNNINDGIVNGNLYIKGYGDPDLSSSDIMSLAEHIVTLNIRQVTGNIVADETYFDDQYYGLAGFYSGDTGPSYWPYVNALTLNKNEGYSNPALTAANLLGVDLVGLNVEVLGVTIAGKTPAGAMEVTKFSRPIYNVLSYMAKESDNQSAITVFKLLGAKLKSNPGSLTNGQEVIESFLTDLGVDRYSYEILEGSGLTRYNKVTADMYIKLLKFMYDDRFLFDYFLNSLSIAGKDGTLKNRMIGTQAEGNIYAKTGTLNGVSALSGYAIDKDNEIVIFYIVMNGFGSQTNRMRDVQDGFCITLAGFSRK